MSFLNKIGLLIYFGVWMFYDNVNGSIIEIEVIKFVCFFVKELCKENILWFLNVLDNYYDIKKSKWWIEI